MKNAQLIEKYWVYDSEVYIRHGANGDGERVTGLMNYRPFEGKAPYDLLVQNKQNPSKSRPLRPRTQVNQAQAGQAAQENNLGFEVETEDVVPITGQNQPGVPPQQLQQPPYQGIPAHMMYPPPQIGTNQQPMYPFPPPGNYAQHVNPTPQLHFTGPTGMPPDLGPPGGGG